MVVIGCICAFDVNYISLFCDNNIINQVLDVYKNGSCSRKLFAPTTFLFGHLLKSNTSQAISLITENIFIAATDYCQAFQAGLEKEGENIRVATFFLNSIVQSPTLDQEKLDRIFEVVRFQFEWYVQCSPIPNNIFYLSLSIYRKLLGFPKKNGYITPEIISYLNFLINVEFIEFSEEERDLSNNPQRVLLSIYSVLFSSVLNDELNKMIIGQLGRIIELTKSIDPVVVQKSYSALQKILIHHIKYIEKVTDLFPCLINGFNNVFAIKAEASKCVFELLRSRNHQIIEDVLLSQLFIHLIEFTFSESENGIRNFLIVFYGALKIIQSSSLEKVILFFGDNDVFSLLESVFEGQTDNLVNDIKSILKMK